MNLEPLGDSIARPPFKVENGYISLPKAPGLGISLDEDALAERPYQAFPPRELRQYHEEGP